MSNQAYNSEIPQTFGQHKATAVLILWGPQNVVSSFNFNVSPEYFVQIQTTVYYFLQQQIFGYDKLLIANKTLVNCLLTVLIENYSYTMSLAFIP